MDSSGERPLEVDVRPTEVDAGRLHPQLLAGFLLILPNVSPISGLPMIDSSKIFMFVWLLEARSL